VTDPRSPGEAGSVARDACERCGDTRIDFDDRYQARCRGCGASRVRAADPERDRLPASMVAPEAILERPRARGWAGRPAGVRVVILLVMVFVAVMIAWTIYAFARVQADGDPLPIVPTTVGS